MELLCVWLGLISDIRWVFLYVVNILPYIFTFNLDTKIPIVKIGTGDSYFGFSVAQHFVYNRSRNIPDSWVLVGAPLSNITDPVFPRSVQNLVRPGAIYKCPLTSHSDDCTFVQIDNEELTGDSDKNDQWLGVSVASQGTDDGKAVACAHRYKKSGTSFIWGLGVCISMTNSLDQEDYWEPCDGRPTDKGHGQYGFCQAGTSTAISKDGDLLIGAPGPYNWRGAIFKNSLQRSFTEEPRWLKSPVEDAISNIPGPEPATGYYSYLGISVKVGNIINGKKTYVSGAPRSKNNGQVLLFQPTKDDLKVELRHYLTGEQFGSSFGSDMAIGDFNSDGKEDLVVGAPFYHDAGVGGAIYVYMNGPRGITKDTKPIRINSRKMKDTECAELDCLNARFGFVLSNIADINRDGFEDLAVGAPYEGDGAVYIFHGSSAGIVQEFSQRIYASDLPLAARPLRTFGYSLSGGSDLDFNGYPDLVVGAFDSSKMIVLRSQPIININASFNSNPKKIDPNLKECSKDGRKNNCFQLTVCFKYTAEPKERFVGPVDLEYKIEAEKFAGVKISRVFFKGTSQEDGHQIERKSSLRGQNLQQCIDHVVYIIKNNHDFLNAIQFHLTYKLKTIPSPIMFPGRPLPDINSYPVLNNAADQLLLSINFIKKCVRDTECLSDLRVNASLDLDKDQSGEYVLRIGQNEELKLNVMIRNNEEEAHETMLYVTLPESLVYRGLDERGKQYSCTPDLSDLVICSIVNPLHHLQEVKFGIRLDPNKVLPAINNLNITLLVNTTSKEINLLNDVTVLKVRVIVEAEIQVLGHSIPREVFFGGVVLGESAIKTEDQIGAEIVHYYEVKNLVGGRVASSLLDISWPYEKEEGHPQGKYLLYLMDHPTVDGPITCHVKDQMVNRLNVTKIQNLRATKEGNKTQSDQKRRKRARDNEIEMEKTDDGRYISVVHMDCDRLNFTNVKCHHFSCNIGVLNVGESVVIKLRFRLWHGTFLEDYRNVNRVFISSKAQINIDRSLNVHQRDKTNDMNKAETIVLPSQEVQEAPAIDWWIIILSVGIGIILLHIIIALLCLCGFFRRQRHEEMTQHKVKLECQNN